MSIWKAASLGELCNVVGGGTPSKSNNDFYQGNIPWATVRDMKSEILKKTEFQITEEAVKNSSTNIIKANNVIIATRVGLGKVCLIKQKTAINQDLRGIIPKDNKKLSFLFLFWWLKSIAHIIEAEGTGATVKGVKLPFIKSLSIPLPSIPEQKRIVAILDEASAAIDQAIANTKRNLANARELFDSYLNEVFTQKGEGWEECALGNEITLMTGFPFKSKSFSKQGINLLRGDNIMQGYFRWDNVKKWSLDDISDYEKYKLEEGDLVLAMDRTWVKAGIKFSQIEKTDLPCLLVQRVARIKPKIGLDSIFLKFLISSTFFKEYVLSIQTGTGVPHISGKQIKNFKFYKPDLMEQKKLATKFLTLDNELVSFKKNYQDKLTLLAELKQSLLQKAFTGELTADWRAKQPTKSL